MADLRRGRRPGLSIISARRRRPLAKVASIAPVVDHAAHAEDGRDVYGRSGVGPAVRRSDNERATDFDPADARRFSISYPGEPYPPRRVADACKSLIRQIPAVGGRCRLPRGRRSTPMAACRTRSTSRMVGCPMRSAPRRNIRPPMVPPAKSTGRTGMSSAGPSGCAFRPTCSMRRPGM